MRRRSGEAPEPEALFDPSSIDVVGLTAGGDAVELFIVADLRWTGTDAQIRSLQAKIHAYVGYAVDGHLAASAPEAVDLPWRIVLRCLSGAPDERTADVLVRTAEPVRAYGGDLEVRP